MRKSFSKAKKDPDSTTKLCHQESSHYFLYHPNLNPVIRPFTFVAQKTYRLDVARVNKTTNSYPRLFVGTCPPEPACSHFWLREHIHVLDEYKRPALPCFSLLIRSKYDAKILYAGSLRLESPANLAEVSAKFNSSSHI